MLPYQQRDLHSAGDGEKGHREEKGRERDEKKIEVRDKSTKSGENTG